MSLIDPRRQHGLSLIELMIALLIGSILLIGVMQIFASSKEGYRLSEGLSRTQENARFALDLLQRDIRMAGHMGCVNDQSLTQSKGSESTLTAASMPLNFGIAIQGFDAATSAPGDTLAIAANPTAGGGAYSPALPAVLDADTGARRIAGSDILVLRFLTPDGVPVTSITGAASAPTFHFQPGRWDVLRGDLTNPGLFAVSDCVHSSTFQARSVDAANGTVSMGAAPNNASATLGFTYAPGQTMLYRAESLVYFIGRNDAGRPALYRLRYVATPNGALTRDTAEVVEGIENMQFIYGQDRVVAATQRPSGFIDRQLTAGQIDTGVAGANANGWRRVGAVQVGLLAASPDRSAARQANDALGALGVTYTAPNDARYRAVYQTTIALRNRLYGN